MLLEAVQVTQIRLRDARAQLGLTQLALAKEAGVNRQAVWYGEHPEYGTNISPVSAWAILNALNRIRRERGIEPPLEYRQMQWKVQGEE